MRYPLLKLIALAAVLLCLFPASAQTDAQPVRVFLLAGQSNMVGYGKTEWGLNPDYDPDGPNDNRTNPREIESVYDADAGRWVLGIGCLREMVVNNPETFGNGGTNPLVGPDHEGPGDGDWIVRDDVSVYSHMDSTYHEDGSLDNPGRTDIGGHTTGFGGGQWNGPEYGFGQIVGNALDQDVVIIKVAFGGRSLDTHFTSPTAAARRNMPVGLYWTQMIVRMHDVLDNIETVFPQYAGREFVVSGFGWHQGYNDRVNRDSVPLYEANMVDFIADIRSEFAEDLPFVIATTGMEMPADQTSQAWELVRAQSAMADFERYPAHAGNVAAVDTTGMYRDRTLSPSTRGFHWNHNGIAYYEIGAGMGEAYLSLVDPRQAGQE